MAQKLCQQLKELGSKFKSLPAAKGALVKLLKQAATCLLELDQSPAKSILDLMQPLIKAIAKPELLKHEDQEVKLLVAVCICEITRITAPEAPYNDDALKDMFQLIVSTFNGLSDLNGPSFETRVVILETIARCRSCILMLDLECDELINEMFDTFFTVIRDDHPENVFTSMQTTMEQILEESDDVQENLLLPLLYVLGGDKKDVTSAGKKLAMNVTEHCVGKLENSLKQFLVSFMSGDSSSLNCDVNYRGVIDNIYHHSPRILSGIIPYLTGELLSDQLDIRLKAVGLVGNLFALPGTTISEEFHSLFLEFLQRLTDRGVEVRMAVLEHVKICLLENPFTSEAPQIFSALSDRLLDYDENVRKKVVSVICDVACHALASIPVDTVKLVSARLRDKSFLVKRYTMERLADIYRASCTNRSSNSTQNDEYDWIIGKILRCFYDKDFRSDTIEPILSLSLFPTDLSVKEKVRNWARAFSGFDKFEVKALERILEQKQRLQQEMQKYLSLRQLLEEGDGTDTKKKVTSCIRALARCFTDPAKAEEDFHSLDQLKEARMWEHLTQLIDPNTSSLQANSSRDNSLKLLDHEDKLFEFLSTLSLRCSYLLFNKDHVKELLEEAGVQKSCGNNALILACMTILVILARFCPLLLRGIEEDLVHLLDEENELIKECTLHILANAGVTIREQLGVSSRSLDLILERICVEGNRRQAKYAVHALASITKDDGLMSLSVLYKTLINMLEEKAHLPAVLQSLGCIAQAAMPVFETRENEIEHFIKENILERRKITGDKEPDCWDDRSELCSLKIFGVKALVKSYLPVKDAHLRSGINGLIEILKNILSFGDVSGDSELSLVDRAHLKLAAAKSVLRLSKHWEHKIPIDVFYLTLRTSEDYFPEVRKVLLNKIHQYVKDRILDPKYACAFLLDISAQQSYLEESKYNLNDIIQMCRQGRGRQASLHNDANPPNYLEYMLPYVVHALAHHPSFPNIDENKDAKIFEAMYRQLHLFLSMLVKGDVDGKSDVSVNKDQNILSQLNSVFLCIGCSEDAFDATKSKNSYALCDLGMSILKRLTPKHDDLQASSASAILPRMLYKPLMKDGESASLVAQEKTWLADDGILAYFDSLELETNGIVQPVFEEDDIFKDSETEGSEIPLGKLLKRLKAKGAKTRKVLKNEPAPAEMANKNDFDILKMVQEINSDNLASDGKLGSSNGHEYVHRKKRSIHTPQKRTIIFSESQDIPVSKRSRMPFAQVLESMPTSPSKGSKRPTKTKRENINDQSVKGKKPKVSSLSKQKGKRSDGDHVKDVRHTLNSKKSKKAPETDSSPSSSYSGSTSLVTERLESITRFVKSKIEDSDSTLVDLIGRRIKVWWPLDKKFYEGIVKSFDSEKKKHVILYEDGDVEVLRLDKECWKFIDNVKKQKGSSSSKRSHPKGGSSEQKRKSVGGSDGEKILEMKPLSPLSPVRGKRTPRKNMKPKQKPLSKIKFSKDSSESPDGVHTELSSKPLLGDSDADKELPERIVESISKELPTKDKKQEEHSEKGVSDAEGAKAKDQDSENTCSDNVSSSPHDPHLSDNQAVSSSSEKQHFMTNEVSGQEEKADNMDVESSALDKPVNRTSSVPDSVDTEPSDDELLSAWKLRVCKKGSC